MATTAGAIGIDIYANLASLQQDLAKANSQLANFSRDVGGSLKQLTSFAGSFASAFAGIGIAVGGAALAGFVKQALDAADAIGDLSERLDISAETLQAFQWAARDVGASAEAFTTGVGRLNKTLGEAGAGNETAIKSFREMGVAFADAGGGMRTTEEIIRAVADRIQGAGTIAEATRIAFEAFGKAGPQLVSVFRNGSAGIDELIQKLKESGAILGGETLEKADQLSREFGKMAQIIQTTLIEAVIEFKPEIMWMIENISKLAQAIKAFVRQTSDELEAGRKFIDKYFGGLFKYLSGLPTKIQDALGFKPLEVIAPIDDSIQSELRELSKLYKDAFAPPRAMAIDPKDTPEARAKAAKEAAKAAEKASNERVAANAVAAKAELAFQEEINEITRKYYEEQEKLAEKLSDAKVASSYQAARAELSFQEEINELVKKYYEEQERAAEKLAEARVAAAFDAAQQELKLQEEVNELTRRYLEDQAKTEEKQMADRMAPVVTSLTGVFDAVDRAFTTSVTGVIQGTTTMENAFANMGKSIALSLNEMVVKQGLDAVKKAFEEFLKSEMVKKLINMGLNLLGSAFGGGAGAGAVNIAPVQNIDYNFGGAGMPMAAGGIVQSPTFATIGEAGPEAVVPLDRWADMQGGGGNVTVNIIDQRKSGNVQTQEKSNQNGERQLDVIITDVVRSGIAGGAYDRALGGSFGINRKGVSR